MSQTIRLRRDPYWLVHIWRQRRVAERARLGESAEQWRRRDYRDDAAAERTMRADAFVEWDIADQLARKARASCDNLDDWHIGIGYLKAEYDAYWGRWSVSKWPDEPARAAFERHCLNEAIDASEPATAPAPRACRKPRL
jgi:hypothetical protein